MLRPAQSGPLPNLNRHTDPPPTAPPATKIEYTKSGLKQSEREWHLQEFPDDPDSSGSSMEGDCNEFAFIALLRTARFPEFKSTMDIPLKFCTKPVSPGLNTKQHCLTIPTGATVREIYDAGHRLYRAVPMRSARKLTHRSDFKLLPHTAAFICAVPRIPAPLLRSFKNLILLPSLLLPLLLLNLRRRMMIRIVLRLLNRPTRHLMSPRHLLDRNVMMKATLFLLPSPFLKLLTLINIRWIQQHVLMEAAFLMVPLMKLFFSLILFAILLMLVIASAIPILLILILKTLTRCNHFLMVASLLILLSSAVCLGLFSGLLVFTGDAVFSLRVLLILSLLLGQEHKNGALPYFPAYLIFSTPLPLALFTFAMVAALTGTGLDSELLFILFAGC